MQMIDGPLWVAQLPTAAQHGQPLGSARLHRLEKRAPFIPQTQRLAHLLGEEGVNVPRSLRVSLWSAACLAQGERVNVLELDIF